LAKGVDPSEAKKKAKAERAETVNTFHTIAEEFLTLQRRNGRAAVTLQKAEWLMGLVYPTLGDRQIRDIRPPEVLVVLQKVEIRGRYATARRLRSTIGSVFRFTAPCRFPAFIYSPNVPEIRSANPCGRLGMVWPECGSCIGKKRVVTACAFRPVRAGPVAQPVRGRTDREYRTPTPQQRVRRDQENRTG
jgi:integrase